MWDTQTKEVISIFFNVIHTGVNENLGFLTHYKIISKAHHQKSGSFGWCAPQNRDF